MRNTNRRTQNGKTKIADTLELVGGAFPAVIFFPTGPVEPSRLEGSCRSGRHAPIARVFDQSGTNNVARLATYARTISRRRTSRHRRTDGWPAEGGKDLIRRVRAR